MMHTRFSPHPTLATERLLLRELMPADAPEVFIQRSDERIIKHTGITKAQTLQDAADFIKMINDLSEKGQSVTWAICRHGENQLIGAICLWNLDLERTIAEVGYSLHPDHWGNGYASEALTAVLGFGFATLGANIIEAHVGEQNLPSVRMLERAGFVKIGKDEALNIYALCRPPLGTVQLETERLRLREITPDDAPYLLELLNTPDWLANIGDRGVRNLDDARKYAIYRIWLNCRLKGFSFYVLERKTDAAKLGMCGLIKRDFLDDVDIGYALLPEFYGQGYAIEAAQAVLLFAKDKLRLPKLAAIVLEANRPSVKLLEKLGMKMERTIQVAGEEEELLLFGLKFDN